MMRRFFRPKRSAICPEAKEAMREETALMVMRLAMAKRGRFRRLLMKMSMKGHIMLEPIMLMSIPQKRSQN